ncbi:hypothetical protein ABZY42_22835 [Streptomyces sp. NPDC006622]|uniref:hypothetical protein n=1 Tax=Streptomyces sp. NPDC006622 TaxID=3155459 RepID=UPI0033A99AAB
MTTVPAPFEPDPEPAAALEPIRDAIWPGRGPEDMETVRRAPGPGHRDAGAGVGGAFEVEDRVFEVEDRAGPGAGGARDISPLSCRPTAPADARPRPVVHHVHGGTILGPHRGGVDQVLDRAR